MVNKVGAWLRWVFRRGGRSVLLLNMSPGDEVVSMISHRGQLAVASRFGEIYLIQEDRFMNGEEMPDMTVFRR